MGKSDLLDWKKIVVDGAREFGIDIDRRQAALLETHASQLAAWNRRMNLTAIRDPVEIAVKHFVDSLAAVPMLPEGASLLDIGSGGGFPGVPLKVAVPSLSVLLIDASRKKTSFLQHLIRTMKLENIEAKHARAEELAADMQCRKKFRAVVCRALADLKPFVELAFPLLCPGGLILAYKANVSESEIDEVRGLEIQTGGRPSRLAVHVHPYRLPILDQPRTLVLIRESNKA